MRHAILAAACIALLSSPAPAQDNPLTQSPSWQDMKFDVLGDRPFLYAKTDGEWRSISWADAARQVCLLAESLLNGGELLTAAEEYARTAYDYPRHVRSADAAHASVLAYHAYAEAQVDTQREPALRQAIDAALRFADQPN